MLMLCLFYVNLLIWQLTKPKSQPKYTTNTQLKCLVYNYNPTELSLYQKKKVNIPANTNEATENVISWLTNNDRAATAQNENRVSTSPIIQKRKSQNNESTVTAIKRKTKEYPTSLQWMTRPPAAIHK
jgi:hypothetical protein